MKKGEICHLLCKPEYAYGAAGSLPKIPSNATLFFEVSLFIAASPARAAPSQGGGAQLSPLQLIYFGAWLLELFPTHAGDVPVLS